MVVFALILGCPPPECPDCEESEPETASPVEDTGDVGLPLQPTLQLADFQSAETCAACHPVHAEQWARSRHAYAMVDPLFRALTDVRRAQAPERDERFCTQCHSALGTRSGDIAPGFDFDELDPLTLEGVTCQSCHGIQDLRRPYNAGHVLDPSVVRGPIQDPMESLAHGSEYSPLFESAELCASCHDVTETTGLPLERPYQEWTQSPAGDEGRPCQSCHMPESTGPAAAGGPTRTLHSHRWLGVEDGLELLEGSATVLLSLPDQARVGEALPVTVTVRNEIDGHKFPTGTTFLRQAWLEVQVLDGDEVLYESGGLDANGDLMDHWSELAPYGDPDLVTLHSGFVDREGDPTLFTHLAAEHASNALQPLQEKTWTWLVDLPEGTDSESLTVTARLRFREAPPHILRLVGLPDELEVTDIDADAGAVTLVP